MVNDYEVIREALEDSTVIIGERRHSKAEALAALDRLKLESMEERASYEAELRMVKTLEELENAKQLMDETPAPTFHGVPIVVADHLPENSAVLVCGRAYYKILLEQSNG